MKIFIALQIVAACLAISILSGCGSSTGWRVEFGVSPIKELKNTAGITQETNGNKQNPY